MTRKQLQSEIVKQFKRRFRREYGRWTDMYTLEVVYNGEYGGDLVTLNFKNEFKTITIIFNNCLTVSVGVTGCEALSCILRVFMNVADECVHWIEYLYSHQAINDITYGNKKGGKR